MKYGREKRGFQYLMALPNLIGPNGSYPVSDCNLYVIRKCQGCRSNPTSDQPLEFLRKYAETGLAQASGPPTAARSTLM